MDENEGHNPITPEVINRVNDDITRMSIDAESRLREQDMDISMEQIAAMSPEERVVFEDGMWKQQYPGPMLCGAANFAHEIVKVNEFCQQNGAGGETFFLLVGQLCGGVLHAHEGHHDGDDFGDGGMS